MNGLNGIPTEDALRLQYGDLFGNEQIAVNFIIAQGIIKVPTECPQPNCGGGMTPHSNGGSTGWKNRRCTRGNCRKVINVMKGTFLEGCSVEVRKVLKLAHLWLSAGSHQLIMLQTGLSSQAVTNYLKNLRDVVGWHRLSSGDPRIGGPGLIIQVDETVTVHRKYHRGHPVPEVWVVGGVELTQERRLFALSVPDRSEPTLTGVLCQHILPGTMIHCDGWKGYSKEALQDAGFEKDTVNHSKNFVDPITGVHTNHVEATWRAIKATIPARGNTAASIDTYISEFIWKREHAGHLWNALMEAMEA